MGFGKDSPGFKIPDGGIDWITEFQSESFRVLKIADFLAEVKLSQFSSSR
jgi:hypothetical protein